MISKGDTKNLQNHLNVFVDGRRVDMPDVEGIVFLNIQSWGAGADAWGTSPDPVRNRWCVIIAEQLQTAACCEFTQL